MSHMPQTHNVPGLWTYKLLRLPFITCCTIRVVAFSKNSTQFIHKTKRNDCEQLLKKIDGLIKSGNSRNNAHSSHGPGAWTSGLLLARKTKQQIKKEPYPNFVAL